MRDGNYRRVPVTGALKQARGIRCITFASPLDLFAVHRFLLTLLYWKADLAGGVQGLRDSLLKGAVPAEVLNAIGNEACRFDLFDCAGTRTLQPAGNIRVHINSRRNNQRAVIIQPIRPIRRIISDDSVPPIEIVILPVRTELIPALRVPSQILSELYPETRGSIVLCNGQIPVRMQEFILPHINHRIAHSLILKTENAMCFFNDMAVNKNRKIEG